ncbi:ATP-binding protein [bacterium]|nr:ATP-binding protein [bacterium]
MKYDFLTSLARTINSGASNSIILHGNIQDLFFTDNKYINLTGYLKSKWSIPGKILLTYELNGPIRFSSKSDKNKLKKAWNNWKISEDSTNGLQKSSDEISYFDEFETNFNDSIGRPTMALELLRQICLCSRNQNSKLKEDLIIIIESADLLLPQSGSISSLPYSDRHRISIVKDWFSDPDFISDMDSVIMLSESTSSINDLINRMPFVLDVEIPSPDLENRKHYISWFKQKETTSETPLKLWSSQTELATLCAGLTIHALRQMLKEAICFKQTLDRNMVINKVETFVKSQLGDDVVEFKKPDHTLKKDVIGSNKLKMFIKDYLIPRMTLGGKYSLTGAAISGPIGAGKTFIFEAVAAEMNMPVLVLKQIRSQWFGQTDLIFERLKRVLEALSKVMIFIDEADTQFGNLQSDTHDTEKRLTGKIQNMMSDNKNKGKIFWFLLTARIHLLSADIRRSGRAGDLIIPVLDPEDQDREDFLKWVYRAGGIKNPTTYNINKLNSATENFYPATFALLRNEVKAMDKMKKSNLKANDIIKIAEDILPDAIADVRRFQTLQALLNCSRKSLLPMKVTDSLQLEWITEISELNRKGIN